MPPKPIAVLRADKMAEDQALQDNTLDIVGGFIGNLIENSLKPIATLGMAKLMKPQKIPTNRGK